MNVALVVPPGVAGKLLEGRFHKPVVAGNMGVVPRRNARIILIIFLGSHLTRGRGEG